MVSETPSIAIHAINGNAMRYQSSHSNVQYTYRPTAAPAYTLLPAYSLLPVYTPLPVHQLTTAKRPQPTAQEAHPGAPQRAIRIPAQATQRNHPFKPACKPDSPNRSIRDGVNHPQADSSVSNPSKTGWSPYQAHPTGMPARKPSATPSAPTCTPSSKPWPKSYASSLRRGRPSGPHPPATAARRAAARRVRGTPARTSVSTMCVGTYKPRRPSCRARARGSTSLRRAMRPSRRSASRRSMWTPGCWKHSGACGSACTRAASC